MTSKTIAPIAINMPIDEDFRIVHPRNVRIAEFSDRPRYVLIGEASEAGFFCTSTKAQQKTVRETRAALEAAGHLHYFPQHDGTDWLIDIKSIAAIEIYPSALKAHVKFSARGRLGQFDVARDVARRLVDILKRNRAYLVLEKGSSSIAIRRDLIVAVEQSATYVRFFTVSAARDEVTLMTGNPDGKADPILQKAVSGFARRRGFVALDCCYFAQVWLDPAHIAHVALKMKTEALTYSETKVVMKGGASWLLEESRTTQTPAQQFRRLTAGKKLAKVDLGNIKLAYDPDALLEAEFTGTHFPKAVACLRLVYGPADQSYTIETAAGVEALRKDLKASGFLQIMTDPIYDVWGKPSSYAAIVARNDMTVHEGQTSGGYTGLELYYRNCSGRRRATGFRGSKSGLVAAEVLAETLAGDAFQLRTAAGTLYFDLKSVEAAVMRSGHYGMVEIELQTKFTTLKSVIARPDAGSLTVKLEDAGLTRIKGFSNKEHDLAYARPEAIRIAFADGGFHGEPHTWVLWFRNCSTEIEDRHAGQGIISGLIGAVAMNAVKADALKVYAKEQAKRLAEQQAAQQSLKAA